MEACRLFAITISDIIPGSRNDLELEAMIKSSSQISGKFSMCLGAKVWDGLLPHGQTERTNSESNSMFSFVLVVITAMAAAAKFSH